MLLSPTHCDLIISLSEEAQSCCLCSQTLVHDPNFVQSRPRGGHLIHTIIVLAGVNCIVLVAFLWKPANVPAIDFESKGVRNERLDFCMDRQRFSNNLRPGGHLGIPFKHSSVGIELNEVKGERNFG